MANPDDSKSVQLKEIVHLIEEAQQYSLQCPEIRPMFSQLFKSFRSQMQGLLATRTIALLPADVLCECFAFACNFDPHDPPALGRGVSMNITALELASVCTRWRGLITKMPTAWSCIDLDLTLLVGSTSNYFQSATLQNLIARTLTTYMSRSRPVPLTIRVRGHFKGDISHERLNFFLTLVTLHLFTESHRWRHVVFDFQDDTSGITRIDLPFSPDEPAEEHLPELQTLSLSNVLSVGNADDSMLRGRVFGASPNLRHLKLTKAMDSNFMAALQESLPIYRAGTDRYPWLDTVVLDRFAYSMTDHLPARLTWALSQLTCVNKVVIMNPITTMNVPLFPPMEVSARDFVVHLGGHKDIIFAALVYALTLPRLRSFEVIIPRGETPASYDAALHKSLFEMFVRSGTLRKLSLKRVPLWAKELMDILHILPALEELILHEPPHKRAPFGYLAGEAEDPHVVSETLCLWFTVSDVVPKLNTLEMVWACGMDAGCVFDMLEERKGITEVRLGTIPPEKCDFRDRLLGLRGSGRKATLVT
ncbi:hypothetical protein CYLTODRAFT_487659 [Cylindrobasidium torrendii FP15055 ss-10]|uniref:F-box domain-containing protein n=1 Tax=Cylindrobasidium torrendii FP15055 ss-10 TaxID=1314674 RepID=A0A0D7BK95_9AGAR|nr:hypothetical protein CYLTODRAFT_487659 [Cylindrobasidium torrendii FP15055 ss-10]